MENMTGSGLNEAGNKNWEHSANICKPEKGKKKKKEEEFGRKVKFKFNIWLD